MHVSRDDRITRPFILTADELKKLCDSVEESAKIKSLVAECADKLDRDFLSLTELLEYENPPNKAIKSLRIYASSTDVTVWIRFYTDISHNVSFSVDGSEEKVIPIIESLEERLSAMRPWYSIVALPDYRGLILEGICALILALAIQRVALLKLGLWDTKISSYFSLFLFTIVILFFASLINILVTRLRKNYFPSGVFAIGQGFLRHQNKETIRTVIIFGFVLEIIGGVAVAFFMTR
jgi:hypothetical protein